MNQDSVDEGDPEFSNKELLKALGMVSSMLGEDDPDDRAGSRAIS